MTNPIVKRLTGYWKMEAGCAIAVPLVAALLAVRAGDRISVPLAVTMAGCGALLIIGAASWRMELARAQGERPLAARLLRWLGPSQRPALIITAATLLAAAASAVEDVTQGGRLTPSTIAALVLGVLTALEYVNYYIAQLQHFDHAADFRRLMTGRGFRRPHLAKAVARWRKR